MVKLPSLGSMWFLLGTFSSIALFVKAEQGISGQSKPPPPPPIPHKLWFTHSHDILVDAEPKHFFNNIVYTAREYRKRWRDVQVKFLDNERCEDEIYSVEPALVPYFREEQRGYFKADICRVAALYLYGGIYMDIDMEVIRPFIPQRGDTFVTAVSNSKDVHPGFMASLPGHPILKESLRLILASYERGEKTHLLGHRQVANAYKNYIKTKVTKEEKNGIYLLEEGLLNSTLYPEVQPQFGEGSCNFVVHDPKTETVHFYTRFVGSGKCQPYGSATIPHSLWFLNRYEIFDIKEEKGWDSNAKRTISRYRDALQDHSTQATFLDRGRCNDEIFAVDPELLTFFNANHDNDDEERQTAKLAMCKMAVLYNWGGYFFDEDLIVMDEPFIADGHSLSFAAVRDNTGLLFEHFVATTPRNPAVLLAIQKLLHACKYGLDPMSLMGTVTVSSAYRGESEASVGESKILEVMKGGWGVGNKQRTGNCRDVIYDGEDDTSYFIIPLENFRSCA